MNKEVKGQKVPKHKFAEAPKAYPTPRQSVKVWMSYNTNELLFKKKS